ncbi:MAG: SPFH/Band 7/PHB domain protein [Syntrophales bacterium]|nr:SPFH/Band 7/PHB domain protein [Syntrophales bacterium]
MTAGVIIILVIVLFVITFAVKGLVIVKQAETMVIERLGKYHRTLSSGVHIIWPIFDTPRSIEWKFIKKDLDGNAYIRVEKINRIDLRETVYDFPKQNVITRDNVVIQIDAVLYFQITDAQRAIYEIANLPEALEKLTRTTLRNVVGELDLDHTLSSRETINQKLRAILDEATDKWGVKVNRVELQDIIPPEDIKVAMEKQMRAERDRRATILEAEGLKQAKILEAEGVRQAEINQAEGMRQALILKAQGEAEARIKVAEAEAEAVTLITKAVKEAGGDPTKYIIAIKYIEALKQMVMGNKNKVVYVPYEASSILGAVGSIKELFGHLKTG